MRAPATSRAASASTTAAAAASVSASLRNDLVRYIRPMARRIRHTPSTAATSTLQECGAHTHAAGGGRTPGIRAPVTYFAARMNALLNRPLEVPRGVDVTVPLYRCPICCSAAAGDESWMTPQEITRHMSWLHASSGSTQANFAAFNALEMARLCRALPSSANAPGDAAATTLSVARVVVLLDVANIELNIEEVLFELLSNEESLMFFRRVACAFVCVHEVFIPHTSRPGHVFFQLSRLHRHSDTFTIYAATRNESGDLVSAALMGDLLLQNMRGCAPAIVLLTKDRVQKSCVAEMFGGVAGRGGRVFLPRITTASILNALREANNMSMS